MSATKTDPPAPLSKREQRIMRFVVRAGCSATVLLSGGAAVTLALDGEPVAAAVLGGLALIAVGAAIYVPRWVIAAPLRTRRGYALAFVAMLTVSTVFLVIQRSWDVALWTALTVIMAAAMVPSRAGVHAPDFRAIQSGETLDERRQQIKLRARAQSFGIITVGAGATALGSLFVSVIRNGDTKDILLWWPALGLYAACLLLDLATTYHQSRRA